MATSLQDLLDAAAAHTSRTPPDPESRTDATAALRHLGRALHRLSDDGLSQEIGGYRERFVTELADACTAAGASPLGDGRLSLLCGAAADLAGLQRLELDNAARWAAALAFAETARKVAAVLADGAEPDPISPLSHLRRTTVLVERTGALEAPTAHQARLLDRQLPWPPNTSHSDASGEITEAMAALLHHTRPGTDLSVAEVLAVCIAAETTCRHATATSPEQHHHGADSAAQAWRTVRQTLRPFNDGSRHSHDSRPPVVDAAIHLHQALIGTSNTAQQPDQPANPLARSDPTEALQLVPDLAEHLQLHIDRWPAAGQVRAYAADLQLREDRLPQQLAGHHPKGLITADSSDLAPTLQTLHDAEVLSTQLALSTQHPGSAPATATVTRIDRLVTINRQRLTNWKPSVPASADVPSPIQLPTQRNEVGLRAGPRR